MHGMGNVSLFSGRGGKPNTDLLAVTAYNALSLRFFPALPVRFTRLHVMYPMHIQVVSAALLVFSSILFTGRSLKM